MTQEFSVTSQTAFAYVLTLARRNLGLQKKLYLRYAYKFDIQELVPQGQANRKRTADIDGNYGEPTRDGNCTDNEILLPDGDAVSRGDSNKTLDQKIYTWTHMRRTMRLEAKTKAR